MSDGRASDPSQPKRERARSCQCARRPHRQRETVGHARFLRRPSCHCVSRPRLPLREIRPRLRLRDGRPRPRLRDLRCPHLRDGRPRPRLRDGHPRLRLRHLRLSRPRLCRGRRRRHSPAQRHTRRLFPPHPPGGAPWAARAQDAARRALCLAARFLSLFARGCCRWQPAPVVPRAPSAEAFRHGGARGRQTGAVARRRAGDVEPKPLRTILVFSHEESPQDIIGPIMSWGDSPIQTIRCCLLVLQWINKCRPRGHSSSANHNVCVVFCS